MSIRKRIMIVCDIINCENSDWADTDKVKEAKAMFQQRGWFFEDSRLSYCPECMKNRARRSS